MLVAAALLHMTACVQALDVLVINPCAVPIRVQATSSSSPPEDPKDWSLVATLPAESTRLFSDVFVDAPKERSSFAASVTIGSRTETLRIPYSNGDPLPLLIPARVCE